MSPAIELGFEMYYIKDNIVLTFHLRYDVGRVWEYVESFTARLSDIIFKI